MSVLEKHIEEISTRMEDMEATIQDLRLRLEFLEADTMPVANRQLIALLDDWLAEEDDLGDEWWNDFERELNADRFTLQRAQ